MEQKYHTSCILKYVTPTFLHGPRDRTEYMIILGCEFRKGLTKNPTNVYEIRHCDEDGNNHWLPVGERKFRTEAQLDKYYLRCDTDYAI